MNSDPEKLPHSIDDLKANPNDHEEILRALDQCRFYGPNSQVLKSKFIPILNICLNYLPKRRMNFFQLNYILSQFEKLSIDEIIQLVNNFSKDEDKIIKQNSSEAFLNLELQNIKLLNELKEVSNMKNQSETAWKSILKTFHDQRGYENVNSNNISQILSELFSSSTIKDVKLAKMESEFNSFQEGKSILKNQIKSIFDLLNQIASSNSVQDIFLLIKKNKETFLDKISQENALDNIEIRKELQNDINIPKPTEIDVKKVDEHTTQGGLDLVQLICSKVFVYKHIFISRFAKVNAKIESPFFKKSREDYECPFCKKYHKSFQLKVALGGDIATLERETIKELEKMPNLKLGKCNSCNIEIQDKQEIFITDCGHFYHLVCMLKKFVLSRLDELKCDARGCTCRINKENIQKYYETDLYRHKMFNCSLCL